MKIPNRKLGWSVEHGNKHGNQVIIKALRMNELSAGWKEERSHYWELIPKSRGESQTKPTENSYCECTVSPPGTQHDRMRTVSLINAGALSWSSNPRSNPVSGLECGHHRPVSSRCRDQVGVSNFLLNAGHLAYQISSWCLSRKSTILISAPSLKLTH